MNIKQKLTWAFAIIACLPVVLVATLVVLNLRSDARDDFVDSSGREIRQVSNAMQLFFDGISQNVEYLATQPLIKNTDDSLKTYMSANAESIPQGEMDKKVFAFLQDLGNSHPAYAYAIVGTAAGGYVSWPDDPKLNNYDPRQRPWYKAAQAKPGKPLRTAAYYWAQDDATYVSTVRTIDNKLGSNGGVVSIDVTLKQLTEIVKQIKLGESGYLMLLENSGTGAGRSQAARAQLQAARQPRRGLRATGQGRQRAGGSRAQRRALHGQRLAVGATGLDVHRPDQTERRNEFGH
ncbi:cache domain-containing protein [Pseudomonas sp. RL_5y_Pfl2_70]|uniref:cache domain-containing protein n=1 Tax=Pseudomonas sp. RL_5y_Pfl2_70 TaxID=3088712 RepID=UPI00403F9BDE